MYLYQHVILSVFDHPMDSHPQLLLTFLYNHFLTRNSICTRNASGRHVVALEQDSDVFEAMLKPLRVVPPDAFMPTASSSGPRLTDDIQIRHVAKCSRFCT